MRPLLPFFFNKVLLAPIESARCATSLSLKTQQERERESLYVFLWSMAVVRWSYVPSGVTSSARLGEKELMNMNDLAPARNARPDAYNASLCFFSVLDLAFSIYGDDSSLLLLLLLDCISCGFFFVFHLVSSPSFTYLFMSRYHIVSRMAPIYAREIVFSFYFARLNTIADFADVIYKLDKRKNIWNGFLFTPVPPFLVRRVEGVYKK